MRIRNLAVLAPLILAGCAGGVLPDTGPFSDPADPTLGIRVIQHRPALADYHHREPVEPQNWRGLNERVAPRGRGAGS